MAISTARMVQARKGIARSRLDREAAARFPRHALNPDAHRWDMIDESKRSARDTLLALHRANGRIDPEDVAATINAASPDDDRLVVDVESYRDMRRHAVACWRLLDELLAAVEGGHGVDVMRDKISDARRFDGDFREAEIYMADVVENCDGME